MGLCIPVQSTYYRHNSITNLPQFRTTVHSHNFGPINPRVTEIEHFSNFNVVGNFWKKCHTRIMVYKGPEYKGQYSSLFNE